MRMKNCLLDVRFRVRLWILRCIINQPTTVWRDNDQLVLDFYVSLMLLSTSGSQNIEIGFVEGSDRFHLCAGCLGLQWARLSPLCCFGVRIHGHFRKLVGVCPCCTGCAYGSSWLKTVHSVWLRTITLNTETSIETGIVTLEQSDQLTSWRSRQSALFSATWFDTKKPPGREWISLCEFRPTQQSFSLNRCSCVPLQYLCAFAVGIVYNLYVACVRYIGCINWRDHFGW